MKELLEELIKKSLDDLYQNDQDLLKRKVAERDLTSLFAHYFRNNMKDTAIADYNVDCEYNRDGYGMKKIDGTFNSIKKASTIEDVKIKAVNLKKEIEQRNGHVELIKYCKEELLTNNYFHAVFEANKGLLERIRELSGCNTDGNELIEYVFSTKNPILIINNFITDSEKNEHRGFCNILKGLCGMFRNPTAHEPKIYWSIEEQDALEILGVISYCHRRLDKAQKIRL